MPRACGLKQETEINLHLRAGGWEKVIGRAVASQAYWARAYQAKASRARAYQTRASLAKASQPKPAFQARRRRVTSPAKPSSARLPGVGTVMKRSKLA